MLWGVFINKERHPESGDALIDRADHGLLGGVQMAVKAVDGFLIVTADQRAENSHVFFNGDDIALFKIGFIPLVVEMENHGNDLQRLVEERVVGGGEDQPVEIAIQLGKQAIVVADVFRSWR